MKIYLDLFTFGPKVCDLKGGQQSALYVLKTLIFRIKQTFDDFYDNPILTSVKTTGYPIQELEHPAIVICGQGNNDVLAQIALYQSVLDFHNSTNFTGQEALKDPSGEKLQELLEMATGYVNEYFPWINGTSNAEVSIKMIELLTSSDPQARISAIVSTQGGFNPCSATAASQGIFIIERI